MRTTENPAYPLRKLAGSKQPVWLDDLALAVYPLGLYDVKPRTLLRKKAAHDPHSSFAAALLDSAVVPSEPAPDLAAYVPGSVVFDATLRELVQPGPRRVTARRPYLLMPWLEIWVRLADEKCRHAGPTIS